MTYSYYSVAKIHLYLINKKHLLVIFHNIKGGWINFLKHPPYVAFVRSQGFEPWTHWLRVSCSTNWAKNAWFISQMRCKGSYFIWYGKLLLYLFFAFFTVFSLSCWFIALLKIPFSISLYSSFSCKPSYTQSNKHPLCIYPISSISNIGVGEIRGKGISPTSRPGSFPMDRRAAHTVPYANSGRLFSLLRWQSQICRILEG